MVSVAKVSGDDETGHNVQASIVLIITSGGTEGGSNPVTNFLLKLAPT